MTKFGGVDATETALILRALDNSGTLMSMMATADLIDSRAVAAFEQIESDIATITAKLATPPTNLMPSAAALAQPAWGIAEPEIPLLPITPRGMVFDQLAGEAASLSKNYLKIRNLSPAARNIIAATKVDIATVKKAAGTVADDAIAKVRQDYVKAVERIFRRVDDGKIFPDQATAGIAASLAAMFDQIDTAKGGLFYVETLLFPGGDIVKSRTQCTEQGPGRWLPKPTDVVATFATCQSVWIMEAAIKVRPCCGGSGCRWLTWLRL